MYKDVNSEKHSQNSELKTELEKLAPIINEQNQLQQKRC